MIIENKEWKRKEYENGKVEFKKKLSQKKSENFEKYQIWVCGTEWRTDTDWVTHGKTLSIVPRLRQRVKIVKI